MIELLIVVSLLSIFAASVLSRWDAGLHDQAQAAARVVAADIAYARNLAVTNNSRYRLAFSLDQNRYVLTHSGSDSRLDVLPASAYGLASDPPTQRTTDLYDLPLAGGVIRLVAVHRLTPAPQNAAEVEFGPLGQTTRSEPTRIWLAAGEGTARRYVAVDIQPATGLTQIGRFTSQSPAAGSTSSAPNNSMPQ